MTQLKVFAMILLNPSEIVIYLSHSTREEEMQVELKTTLITQNRIHILAGTQRGDLKTFNNRQQTWGRTHYK